MELDELIGKLDELINEAKINSCGGEKNEAREDLREAKNLLDEEFLKD